MVRASQIDIIKQQDEGNFTFIQIIKTLYEIHPNA